MDTQAIEKKIDEIEAEMKRLGMWQEEPLPEEAYKIKEAFGADTMTFPQWLQFVLVPTVRNTLTNGGEWPKESEVGIYATQQFMSFSDESHLVELLREFDALFNK